MSTKYKQSKNVPNNILAKRLEELSNVITKNRTNFQAEFTMRVPAELDRDADLVFAEAAKRLKVLERMTVLAIKHCPRDHHDYQEIVNRIED